jgi:hypothetical protein
MSDEIVAREDTFAMIAVKEDVVRDPVLTVRALMNWGKTGFPLRPATVETNDAVETYPIVPNPVTVDVKLFVVNVPPPKVPMDVEKLEKAAPIAVVLM